MGLLVLVRSAGSALRIHTGITAHTNEVYGTEVWASASVKIKSTGARIKEGFFFGATHTETGMIQRRLAW